MPGSFKHASPPLNTMIFVDGENLACRIKSLLSRTGRALAKSVQHEPDVFVWSPVKLPIPEPHPFGVHVVRTHYYTSITGDELKIRRVEETLKAVGIQRPYVFRKTKQRGSKQLDITLTTDMLIHAYRQHYEMAVLIAGDEDYVPLVDAVQREGRRVFVGFIDDGLSPALKIKADHCFDLTPHFLVDPSPQP